MVINLAGLLATAVLLVTLVALELRRAGPDTGHSTRPRLLGRTVDSRVVVVIWAMYLILFLPRVLGLLL